MLLEAELTNKIIGATIEVHKNLGPGLLEAAYEACLCHELSLHDLSYERQVHFPIVYKDASLDCGYRIDLIAEDTVIIELKSMDELIPIHEAQLLTYMRLSNKRIGFQSILMFVY